MLTVIINKRDVKNYELNQLHLAMSRTHHQQTLLFSELSHYLHRLKQLKADCDSLTHGMLQDIALNDPKVVLGFISYGKKIHCSNLKRMKITPLSLPLSSGVSLHGPIHLPLIKEPSYILSTYRAPFHYALVLRGDIFSHTLKNPLDQSSFIALIDSKKNHVLYKDGEFKKPKASTVGALCSASYQQLNYEDNSQILTIASPISPLEKTFLVIGASKDWIWKETRMHLLLIVLFSLGVCVALICFIILLTKKQLSVRAALLKAVKHKQFIPHYQPVIDLASNHCIGVEVLLRWNTGNDTLIMPNLFLPSIEKNNLLETVTEQLINTVFEELGEHLKAHRQFHIAINIGPQHFKDRRLLDNINKHCHDYDVWPSQVLFELTEQELIEEDNTFAIELMNTMRKQGYSLALDDFGTGYSSINYLQRFPFNYLKLDQQFVMAIGSQAVTSTLVDSMVIMGKKLELLIIAEGVETAEHAAHLTSLKVEYAQGYYYAKPMGLVDLLHFLYPQND